VISTGSKAFVRLGGRVYALRPSQVAGLRGSSPLGAASGLGQLSIGSWFRNPDVSDGGQVDGVETEHVHSDLNVVPAANGLIGLANSAGRQAGGPLQGRSARELVRSVKSATIDVWTGKDDHFLRRLVIDAQLAANVPARVKAALGTLGAVHFHLELGIASPNEPVHVSAPANARPLPA